MATPREREHELPAFESSATRAVRRLFRWYRNLPFAVGHPLLRRGLRACLQRRQRIVLRSGLRLELDLDRVVQHTIFWLDGDMEPQLSWAVREFLPVGGRLIDCGANCGYIGLEARLLRAARVLFVEPHPELANTIAQNIRLNGWQDTCILYQGAASDAEGTAPLWVCEAYDGSHSLLPDWWKQPGAKHTITVPLTTLRKLMETQPGFESVDFLKVDTEGHDYSVLLGLGDWLEPSRVRMIYAELGRNRDLAYQLLRQRGYAGFGYQRLRGSELRRVVHRWARGETVVLFRPLGEGPGPEGETLWCPKGSPAETHLHELAARA